MMACGIHALEDLPNRVLVHLRLLVSSLHVRQLPYENLAPHPLPFLLARQARRDVHGPKLLAAIPELRGIGGELVQQRILPFRQVRTLEVVQERVAVVVEHLVGQAVGDPRLELQLAHIVASCEKVLLHGFERIAPEDVDDLRPAVCGLELQRLGVPRHAARSQPGTNILLMGKMQSDARALANSLHTRPWLSWIRAWTAASPGAEEAPCRRHRAMP